MAPTEGVALPVDVSDEPLIGWRCWYVLPHEGLLRPIFKRGLVWKPRQAQEAVCPEHPHAPPADDCKCGVWTVCHPLLLDEIGWTTNPPAGVEPLPGVMVVGEVALWGTIIQHERGWRASTAYPRHLYAFTDDPMLADTLRERYGVPVEWGADAERLRRLLPVEAREQEAREQERPAPGALREILLDVLRGRAPAALVELAGTVLDSCTERDRQAPKQREDAARRCVQSEGPYRAQYRRELATAAADCRALDGSTVAARRVLWLRLARWARGRYHESAHPLGLAGHLASCLDIRAQLRADVARGTTSTGRPYTVSTCRAKTSRLKSIEQSLAAMELEIDHRVTPAALVPSYRVWVAMVRGSPAANSQMPPLEWHRQAMQREAQLAQVGHELAGQRHALLVDRAAIEESRGALAEERARLATEREHLCQEILAGIVRDRAELLREVGELERRRRAALAFLPDPGPPALRPRAAAGTGHPALAARLLELRISEGRVAQAANCSRSTVHQVLWGRVGVRSGGVRDSVLRAAQILIAAAEGTDGAA